MKKIVQTFTLLATFLLLFGQQAYAEVYSGVDGNISWSLDTETGVLALSGNGSMKGYYGDFSSIPWYSYRSDIKSVEFSDGITNIGREAFCDCTGLTSVTIPESVTWIGIGAFFNCHSLKSVSIPEGVTGIGEGAFSGCSSLTSVTIPAGVTGIGEGAFSGCSSLTSVTIPAGVTSIDRSAFSGCSSLTSVTIPEGVTSIGEGAFSGCSSLTSVTIPESVSYIYTVAFAGSGLTDITIPNSVQTIIPGAFSDTPWYENQEDGLLYLGNYLLGIKGSIPQGTLIIKDGTKRIAPEAFRGRGITNITIPNSVTSIGIHAFMDCSNLASVTISSSVKEIGEATFYDCTSLTSVTIPEGVTSIGWQAFAGCTGLTNVTIPSSMTSIYYEAFSGCTSLTSVTIPEGVTSIGGDAFARCSSLTNIQVQDGNSYYDSRDNCNAIIETASNTLVAGCQSTVIPNSVTSIGDYAFGACSGLTSITIPNSVTSIGYAAFHSCTGLTSITIPSSVTSIGEAAFSYCSSLTSVTLESVSCMSSDDDIFSSCSSLQAIYVPYGSGDAYKSATGWSEYADKIVELPYSGDEIVAIADYDGGIGDYGVPTGVVKVISANDPGNPTSDEDFYYIDIDTTDGGYNSDVDYPVLWTDIDRDYKEEGVADKNRDGKLSEVDAFDDDDKDYKGLDCHLDAILLDTDGDHIAETEWEKEGAALSGVDGNIWWQLNIETRVLALSGNGGMKDYGMFNDPEIFGEVITDWSPWMGGRGENIQYIRKVIIEDGITSIGGCAFCFCENLEEIEITDDVTYFGKGAFYGCRLISIDLPNNLVSIDNESFSGCPLTSLHIPAKFQSVYVRNFPTQKLTSIDVDENNPYFDSRNGCNAIIETATNTLILGCANTVIPNDVTRIGDNAFGALECPAIVIPASVKWIGYEAFYNSEVNVIMESPVPCELNRYGSPFGLMRGDILVPAGSAEIYKSAEGWSYYANRIVEMEPEVQQDNMLHLENSKMFHKSQLTIPVLMKNAKPFTAFQCDITLPEGLTLHKTMNEDDEEVFDIAYGSRAKSTHSLMANQLTNGNIRVAGYSSSNADYRDSEGMFFTLTVDVADDASGDLTIKLSNVILTSATDGDTECPDTEAVLTIIPGQPGDVNGDGKLTMGDVVKLVNHILEVSQTGFNADLADVNEDGKVTMGDVVIVLNMILSGDYPVKAPFMRQTMAKDDGEYDIVL